MGGYDFGLPKFIADMGARHPHVKFVVDITYVGLVQKTFWLKLDTLPNVEAVVFSLSKTFGVYYERIGGVFLRKEHAGFGGLGWFKNVRSIVIGLELLGPGTDPGVLDSICRLPNAWRKYQRKAIALHKACGLLPKDARPSNASLLALSDGPPPIASVNGFLTFSLRDGTYRYCLSGTIWHLMREDERTKKEGK